MSQHQVSQGPFWIWLTMEVVTRGGVKASNSTSRFLGEFVQSEQADESRLRLHAARRQMSTEIILVINELYVEFFTSAVAIILGIVFRDSDTFSTQLRSELSWDMLPLFVGVAYGPEFVEACLIAIYLRHVGVDCLGLCKEMLRNGRCLMLKLLLMVGSLFLLILAGIDSR